MEWLKDTATRQLLISQGCDDLFRKGQSTGCPLFFMLPHTANARYNLTRLNSSNSLRSGQVRPSITVSSR